MIIRANWLHVEAYLLFREQVNQLATSSLRLEKGWLDHLLEWAQNQPFEKAPKIRPALPEFMLTARLDGLTGQFVFVNRKTDHFNLEKPTT